MVYEFEILSKRFCVNKREIQQSIDYYFERHFCETPDYILRHHLHPVSLEHTTEWHGVYCGIILHIQFIKEGSKQLWVGWTDVGDGPFARHEHVYGYIELSQVKVSSEIPVDVRIVCGWPPLFQFFHGMADHLLRYFQNRIYHLGLDQEKDSIRHILEGVRDRQIEIAETVKSLRHWAKAVQQSGLPADKDLRDSVHSLAKGTQNLGGVYQYLEINLPLVPGILSCKAEIGSQHQIELAKLWDEIQKTVSTD